jgi:hypothetical protein
MTIPAATNSDFHFRWRHDWARSMLAAPSKFKPEYFGNLVDIQKLMSPSVFELAHTDVLARLRAKIATGCNGQKTADEGKVFCV